MSKNTITIVSNQLRQSGGEFRDNPPEPHLRDVLKREHDEAQKRPNEALDKWNDLVGEMIKSRMNQGGRLHRVPLSNQQRDMEEPGMDLG
jgi:hypothetical protein